MLLGYQFVNAPITWTEFKTGMDAFKELQLAETYVVLQTLTSNHETIFGFFRLSSCKQSN